MTEVNTTEEQLSIPAKDLMAVLPFRARQDIRYYLDGISIEPVETGGCMIVATDGHLLGAIHSPNARASSKCIIRITKEMDKAIRELPGRNEVRTVSLISGRLTLLDNEEVCVQPGQPFIDYDKYPDWRKILPPVEQIRAGAMGLLSAKYLAKLFRVTDSQYPDIKFFHDCRNPEKSATIAQVGTVPGLVILIMPMYKDRPWAWPDWMPREPPAAESTQPVEETTNG